jgi:hypothetical protein
VTVVDCDVPADAGTGSPVTCMAELQFAEVIADVL